MNKKILTIKDVIEFLQSEVAKNPEVATYQVSKYEYDDFNVGCFTFGCTSIEIIDLPKNNGFQEGVDCDLVTPKILTIG